MQVIRYPVLGCNQTHPLACFHHGWEEPAQGPIPDHQCRSNQSRPLSPSLLSAVQVLTVDCVQMCVCRFCCCSFGLSTLACYILFPSSLSLSRRRFPSSLHGSALSLLQLRDEKKRIRSRSRRSLPSPMAYGGVAR